MDQRTHSEPWSHWCSNGTASGSSGCKPIRWLHVPKAGTTFGLAVYRYACSIPPSAHIPTPHECGTLMASHPWRRSNVCNDKQYALERALTESFPPDKYCSHLSLPFTSHEPAGSSDAGQLVAMFRHPLGRAASLLRMMQEHAARGAPEWSFFKGTGGNSCPNGNGPKKQSDCCPVLLQEAPQNTSLSDFYRRGGACVAGCQTKMVLGLGCHSRRRLADNDIKQACAMVMSRQTFRFVGVTELWEDSISLFHSKLGGSTVAAELLNTRPGEDGAAALHEDVVAALRVAHPNEAADLQLYECARSRMLADLLQAPGEAWQRVMRAPAPVYDYSAGAPLCGQSCVTAALDAMGTLPATRGGTA